MNQKSPFQPATVGRVQPVSDELFELSLEVPQSVAHSFTTPGQYHLLEVDGMEPKPFAIASAPGTRHFEYLVRRGFGVADALASPGVQVRAGNAEGPGFPLEASRGRDLLLVATGTGVAPMRSVLQVVRARRSEWGRVVFVLGGRHPHDFGWQAEWPRWEADGVEVRRSALAGGPGWSGPVGNALDLLPESGLEKASVFLVGTDQLVAEVKETLAHRGVDPRHVHLNL